jgi:uncharacterized membrane protein YuzA (DUF378 family)
MINLVKVLFGSLSALGFVILLIVIGPIATIWSLNTMFPVLDIPYDVEHWLAALVLAGIFKRTITANKEQS